MISNNIILLTAYIAAALVGGLSFGTGLYLPTIIGSILVLWVFYLASLFMKSYETWKKNLMSISFVPLVLIILVFISLLVPRTTRYIAAAVLPFVSYSFLINGGDIVRLFAIVSVALVSFLTVFINVQYMNTAKVRRITAGIIIVFIVIFFLVR